MKPQTSAVIAFVISAIAIIATTMLGIVQYHSENEIDMLRADNFTLSNAQNEILSRAYDVLKDNADLKAEITELHQDLTETTNNVNNLAKMMLQMSTSMINEPDSANDTSSAPPPIAPPPSADDNQTPLSRPASPVTSGAEGPKAADMSKLPGTTPQTDTSPVTKSEQHSDTTPATGGSAVTPHEKILPATTPASNSTGSNKKP